MGDASGSVGIHQPVEAQVLLRAVLKMATIENVPGGGPEYPDHVFG